MLRSRLSLAFRHTRSLSTRESPAAVRPSDRVLLSGLQFHAHHGVLPAERDLGQKFRVDVTLDVDTRDAGCTDDLTRTVDYAAVYECVVRRNRPKPPAGLALTRTRTSCLLPRCVRHVVQGPPKQLVECVAHEVAKHILRGFPLAQGVSVRVTKPHVAVPGALEALGAWRQHACEGWQSLYIALTLCGCLPGHRRRGLQSAGRAQPALRVGDTGPAWRSETRE
jgi:dihydroneopterin aldolase